MAGQYISYTREKGLLIAESLSRNNRLKAAASVAGVSYLTVFNGPEQESWYEKGERAKVAKEAGIAITQIQEQLIEFVDMIIEAKAKYLEECSRRMPPEDIIARLSAQAMGIGPYLIIDDENKLSINYARLLADDNGHLIKGIKNGMRGNQSIDIESSKAALDSLARIEGLFVDKTQLTGANGGPIEIEIATEADYAEANEIIRQEAIRMMADSQAVASEQ